MIKNLTIVAVLAAPLTAQQATNLGGGNLPVNELTFLAVANNCGGPGIFLQANYATPLPDLPAPAAPVTAYTRYTWMVIGATDPNLPLACGAMLHTSAEILGIGAQTQTHTASQCHPVLGCFGGPSTNSFAGSVCVPPGLTGLLVRIQSLAYDVATTSAGTFSSPAAGGCQLAPGFWGGVTNGYEVALP